MKERSVGPVRVGPDALHMSRTRPISSYLILPNTQAMAISPRSHLNLTASQSLMHEPKLSKGKAREDTHWQLGWWELLPLVDSPRYAKLSLFVYRSLNLTTPRKAHSMVQVVRNLLGPSNTTHSPGQTLSFLKTVHCSVAKRNTS